MNVCYRFAVASLVGFAVSGLAHAAAPTLPSAPVPYSQLKDIDAQMNGPAKSKPKADKPHAKTHKAAKTTARSLDIPDCPSDDPRCPHN